MAKVDFSRSIITSTVKIVAASVVNGEVKTRALDDIVLVGTTKVSEEKALKAAKAKHKYESLVMVIGIEYKEEVRGMDFETFMKHSVPVERPVSQTKEGKAAKAN